jgi:hypothetical protein
LTPSPRSGYDMAKLANIVTEFIDMDCLMFTAMASRK